MHLRHFQVVREILVGGGRARQNLERKKNNHQIVFIALVVQKVFVGGGRACQNLERKKMHQLVQQIKQVATLTTYGTARMQSDFSQDNLYSFNTADNNLQIWFTNFIQIGYANKLLLAHSSCSFYIQLSGRKSTIRSRLQLVEVSA
jgi:hypothetical protein